MRTSAVGAIGLGVGDQPAAGRAAIAAAWRIALGQAGDREVAVVVHEACRRPRANRGPPRPAMAKRRIEGDELARQRAGIEVAGRLAAGNQETRAQDAGRWNSAASIGALTFTSMTRRSTDSGPTFCVARKAIWMPSIGR